jgi:hypothetical protein
MQNVSDEAVQEARKLIRTFPQCPMIRSDARRPVNLREFISIIRDEIDDISDIPIEVFSVVLSTAPLAISPALAGRK